MRRKIRIKIPLGKSLEDILQIILLNKEYFFKLNDKKYRHMDIYRINNHVFKVPNQNVLALKSYFPNIYRILNHNNSKLYQVLKDINNVYLELSDDGTIKSLKEGLVVTHANVNPEPLIEINSSRLNDINILNNIFFTHIIKSYNMAFKNNLVVLKLKSHSNLIYNFESTSIEEVIFEAILYLMKKFLNYSEIGIGRTRDEAYRDFIMKNHHIDKISYCTDSLSRSLGLVLVRINDSEN